jgi:hypothetical protein
MRRYALRDDPWQRSKDLLPGREGHVGVTAKDNRLFVEAALHRYRAGIPPRGLWPASRRDRMIGAAGHGATCRNGSPIGTRCTPASAALGGPPTAVLSGTGSSASWRMMGQGRGVGEALPALGQRGR